jgi:hypothetical protein
MLILLIVHRTLFNIHGEKNISRKKIYQGKKNIKEKNIKEKIGENSPKNICFYFL